ncbi:MAG: hypothetical protein IPO32_19300 [Crocinitomicaceae bacterium]|nr:hypothetical protein [Crocinitomicaceae bacterium]
MRNSFGLPHLAFCFVAGFYLYHYQLRYYITESDVKKFEKSFPGRKVLRWNPILKEFLTGIKKRVDQSGAILRFAREFSKQKLKVFHLHQRFFNTLDLPIAFRFPVHRDTLINISNIVLPSNGWYKIEHITAGDKLYVAAMLIKHEYDFENDV